MIKQHVVELGVPPGSGVGPVDILRFDVQVIFHEVEVHEPGYPPGAIFR